MIFYRWNQIDIVHIIRKENVEKEISVECYINEKILNNLKIVIEKLKMKMIKIYRRLQNFKKEIVIKKSSKKKILKFNKIKF